MRHRPYTAFQSTPPQGGRPFRERGSRVDLHYMFQSTPPQGGATAYGMHVSAL